MLRKHKLLASINITPLVDVLLILLVIVMLLVPLIAKQLPVSLPKTNIDADLVAKLTVKVVLQKDGQYLLGDRPAKLAEIIKTIDSSSSVEIYPDKAVVYDRIAGLVAKIQEKSPHDLSLVTQ